jgi:hypothetical protein
MAHVARAAHPGGPIASTSRHVIRADADPATSTSSSFNGQSYALGLLTGLGIAAALVGSYLFLRSRRAAQQRRKRTTLTPDKYSYVVPGTLAGHHIITEPVLGEEEEGMARRPGSPTGTATTADGWGAASTVHDHMSASPPGSAYTPSLPAAMRDARGRFHAPSEPGSPLTIPDRAFAQSSLVRPTSTISGSSHGGTSRLSSLISPRSSRHNPFSTPSQSSHSLSLASSSTMTTKERLEKENALKNRLGMRMRNASVDELRIVNAGPPAGGSGDGALPPYSREEDPDPFAR